MKILDTPWQFAAMLLVSGHGIWNSLKLPPITLHKMTCIFLSFAHFWQTVGRLSRNIIYL